MRDFKTLVFLGAAALILVGCTQPTAPSRDDTSCRSGVSISSGRDCR